MVKTIPKLRLAKMEDLTKVTALLRLLDLPTEGVRENIEHFFVAEEDGKIIGSVGLELYDDTCLLRSLAVHPGYQGRGLGAKLMKRALDYAREREMKEIVLLTMTAKDFVKRFGFEEISREATNPKVKVSVEFRSTCPASATCMRLRF